MSDIDLTHVRNSADLAPAARTLDTYFSGVNTHKPSRAASVFTTDSTLDPSNHDVVRSFGKGTSTTHDDQIVLWTLQPTEFARGAGVDMHVTFRSRQASYQGPAGETCTVWKMTYYAVTRADRFQIFKVDAVHQPC